MSNVLERPKFQVLKRPDSLVFVYKKCHVRSASIFTQCALTLLFES